jgi:hypothetical protein
MIIHSQRQPTHCRIIKRRVRRNSNSLTLRKNDDRTRRVRFNQMMIGAPLRALPPCSFRSGIFLTTNAGGGAWQELRLAHGVAFSREPGERGCRGKLDVRGRLFFAIAGYRPRHRLELRRGELSWNRSFLTATLPAACNEFFEPCNIPFERDFTLARPQDQQHCYAGML